MYNFERGFKSIGQNVAQGTCLEWLRNMVVSLGTTYLDPMDIGLNWITCNWAGFIKLHLQNPLMDGLTLLKGDRAFTMRMEGGIPIISQIEKSFELAFKAHYLRIHLQRKIQVEAPVRDVFKTIEQESYYKGGQHEFLTLPTQKIESSSHFLH